MKTLIDLTAKLRNLYRDLEYERISIQRAERKLNTCEALTEHLYSYSSQHSIPLQNYADQLLNIVSISQDINDEISRQKHLAKVKTGQWKNSLNAVIKITNIVLSIIGVPITLHPLPDDTKLLDSTSNRKFRR